MPAWWRFSARLSMAGSAVDMTGSITATERFWPLDRPALAAWRRAGVLRAGLGTYPAGWRIAHVPADRHLVAWCLAGGGQVTTAGRTQRLGTGQAWIAPAGAGYALRAQGEWRLAWWYLDPAGWPRPQPTLDAVADAPLLEAAATALCRETEAPSAKPPASTPPDPRPPAEDRAWLLAGLLLAEVRRLLSAAGSAAGGHRRWLAALAALRADPGGIWSVASLAARAGVSQPTLRRLVHDGHGCTVRDLILGERMLLARQLLRLSDLADPFAFARAFRRHQGRWPSSLRERNAAGAGSPPPGPRSGKASAGSRRRPR
jgi:AraC-like DNA-binding protein